MTDSERLIRIETRQEALVSAINGLTDVTETNGKMLAELMKWLQEPPSSDLPDLIRTLTEAVMGLQDAMANLPAQVARAVQTGEVP